MAQKTQLTILGISGQVQSFVAKTETVPVVLFTSIGTKPYTLVGIVEKEDMESVISPLVLFDISFGAKNLFDVSIRTDNYEEG